MTGRLRLLAKKPRRLAMRASKVLSRRGLHAFLEKQFQDIDSGANVLSIGAGGEVNRQLVRRAQAKGFNVTQLDVSPDRSPDIVADVCHWKAPESFDVIIAAEVLEHLHSPADAVSNLHASLKPAGTLIVTVPFIYPIHERPVDYFRYTRFGLERLLSQFSSVEIRERDQWPEALLVLLARSFKSGSRRLQFFSPFISIGALFCLPLALLVGKLMPADYITSGYLVVARK